MRRHSDPHANRFHKHIFILLIYLLPSERSKSVKTAVSSHFNIIINKMQLSLYIFPHIVSYLFPILFFRFIGT